jgi:hypothetical protein
MSITQRTARNTNYLSKNRFKVVFPRVPNVEYFCQGIEIPQITVPPVEQHSPFSIIKRVGINATFPPITLNIISDEDFVAWQEVHDWMVGTAFPRSFEEYQEVYGRGLYAEMHLIMLSNGNTPTVSFIFHGIFPSGLGTIDLLTTEDGTENIVFPATFNYTDYEIRRIKYP